ncbi:MAG: glucose-6-phosphate isomerase [Congregibacter sp.]
MTSDTDQAWAALSEEHAAMASVALLDLFHDDEERAADFSIEAAGLFLDYSKNRISRRGLDGLLTLAETRGLASAISDLLSGARVNTTEDRPALHTALRDCTGRRVDLDTGEDAVVLAAKERERMLHFVDEVHAGRRRGATGKRIHSVVNIGIGGSDLGPLMVVEALRPFWKTDLRCRFVSNVDGQHLSDTLEELDWETTLFLVASKTFTTQETMTNARSARDWFGRSGGRDEMLSQHFVALSTNASAVREFGIPEENTFGFWDWVGGRYSLWSSIGMSIALQVGREHFDALLDGASAMDEHFRQAPLAENMPVVLAMTGIWNRNIEGMPVHAVLPYDQHLHRLPAYLQQADMESNGKGVTKEGRAVEHLTGPVIFGEAGTNGQHAFYQLIHQGPQRMSCDFIVVAEPAQEVGDHHRKLLANALAQPRALMCGKDTASAEQELLDAGVAPDQASVLAPHKTFPGSRPSNTLLMRRLTPHSLGALIALYEHKIFCQGHIWGINSFDQWGVELGKQLASELLPLVDGNEGSDMERRLDASTRQLLRWINRARG